MGDLRRENWNGWDQSENPKEISNSNFNFLIRSNDYVLEESLKKVRNRRRESNLFKHGWEVESTVNKHMGLSPMVEKEEHGQGLLGQQENCALVHMQFYEELHFLVELTKQHLGILEQGTQPLESTSEGHSSTEDNLASRSEFQHSHLEKPTQTCLIHEL
ncbi:hypothetical protein VNO78_09250 [Psophocarpus tetragonolobus]|uniref:Uncharacterized protein n=1 Tax=Psophocarpus tetragonolobus TaxID=3891 RepID=A0AAN9XTX9_PSOTE